jgi:hypothetical protein
MTVITVVAAGGIGRGMRYSTQARSTVAPSGAFPARQVIPSIGMREIDKMAFDAVQFHLLVQVVQRDRAA